MQNSVVDNIFKELRSYDSVFVEILEQAEKEKKEKLDEKRGIANNLRQTISHDVISETLGTWRNENYKRSQKKDNESTAHKQAHSQFESTSGTELMTEKLEESVDSYCAPDVPSEEEKIAKELRKCSNVERETSENLLLSSHYLLELGKIYLDYAVSLDMAQGAGNRDDVQQYLNFIKAAALLVGEKLPHETLKEKGILFLFHRMIILLFPKLSRFHGENKKIDHVNADRDFDILAIEEEMERTPDFYHEEIDVKRLTASQIPEKISGDSFQDDNETLFRENIKVNNGDGIQQNVNFVKAAALIVGAMVRCEIIKESELIEDARTELSKLHQKIMEIDHVRGDRNVDICAFTEEIKCTLEFYRKEIAIKLETIAKISEGTNESDEMRVSDVREICERCTKYYLDIMAKVAEKCESIMGTPPCKFSIIGLGSLAKKEVTLYSDFEHAILLEDGVCDDSEVIEYFRWFSTIFQVIIIGLGETVIPSVGVKSLNDFYSSDDRKNWFRDEYTPCGVSVDGMMPRACKIPFGRQEATKQRSHTVELIQPVSKMVNFVTKEEEIKNGYYLSDILRKVCSVFGNQEVYGDYVQKLNYWMRSRTKKEIAEQQHKLIVENPNLGVKSFDHKNLISDEKIKSFIYRPLTTLLSCAAALHSLTAKSSFEIVDELRDLGIIDKHMHRKLMSAVATVMEISLKTSLQAGNQRKTVITPELEDQVGRERLINFYTTLDIWRNWVFKHVIASQGFESVESSFNDKSQFTILVFFQEHEKAMRLCLDSILHAVQRFRNSNITAMEARTILSKWFDSLCICSVVLWEDELVNAQELGYTLISSLAYQDLEFLYGIVRRYREKMNYIVDVYWHYYRDQLYRYQDQFEKAREQKLEGDRFMIKIIEMELSTGISFMLNRFHIDEMLKVMSPDECLQHLNELLDKLRLGICQALLKKGMKKQARDLLFTIKTDIKKNARRLGKYFLHDLLFKIYELQGKKTFVLDMIRTGIILEENAYEEESHKVIKATSGSLLHEKEYLQRKRELNGRSAIINLINFPTKGVLEGTRSNGLTKIFGAFSHKEMIHGVKYLINETEQRSMRAIENRLTLSLMVLCENAHATDLNFLIDVLQKCPYKVRARLILQPFLYGLFADFIQRTSTRASFQTCTRDQFSMAVSKQRVFVDILFRYFGKEANLHNLAVTRFKEFRFIESAKLSWRQLQRRGVNHTLQKRSMKLFLTTVLATVVLQKRKRPAEYFKKTREISFNQQRLLYLSRSDGELLFDNVLSKIHWIYWYNFSKTHWIYWYNFQDKEKTLAQVYNLAVECNMIHPRRGVILFWRIIHAPNVTASVMKNSLHHLIIEVGLHVFLLTDPISLMKEILKPSKNLMEFSVKMVATAKENQKKEEFVQREQFEEEESAVKGAVNDVMNDLLTRVEELQSQLTTENELQSMEEYFRRMNRAFKQLAEQNATKTQNITPQGGSMEIEGCGVRFPPVAVTKNTDIKLLLGYKTDNFPKSVTVISPSISLNPSKFNVPVVVKLTTWFSAKNGKKIKAMILSKSGSESEWKRIKEIVLTGTNAIEYETSHFCKHVVAISNQDEEDGEYHLLNDVWMHKKDATIVSLFCKGEQAVERSHRYLTEQHKRIISLPRVLLVNIGNIVAAEVVCDSPPGMRITKLVDKELEVTTGMLKKMPFLLYFRHNPHPEKLRPTEPYELFYHVKILNSTQGTIDDEFKDPLHFEWPLSQPEKDERGDLPRKRPSNDQGIHIQTMNINRDVTVGGHGNAVDNRVASIEVPQQRMIADDRE